MARFIEVDFLVGTPLSLYHDSALGEYEVRVNGQRDGDENYFTSHRDDALGTAREMLKELEIINSLRK